MLKKIFLGGTASIIHLASVTLAALIQSALAVRFLPKVESSIWFLFLNVIWIYAFFDFGLTPTLSREIGLAYKKPNYNQHLSNLFFTVRKITIFMSVFIAITLLLFGCFYLNKLPTSAYHIKHILYAFIILSTGIIVRLQTNPQLAVIYGSRYIFAERLIFGIGVIIGLIVGIILVLLHFGLIGLATGYLFRALSIFILARWFFARKINIPEGAFLKTIAKKIFDPCLQWSIMNVGGLLIFQISNFIIAYYLGVQNVAQFAVLMQIFTAILMVTLLINLVLSPFISKTYGEKNYPLLKQLLTITVRLSVASVIILSIYFCFYIKEITFLWLGNKFVVHYATFIVLMITLVLEAQHTAFASIAMAAGYVKFAVIAIIAGVLNLILSFIFIYKFGVFGAALAIFVSQLTTNNWYAVKKPLQYFQYPASEYLKQIVFPLVLFLAYAGITTFIVHKLMIFHNLFITVASSAALTAIFAVGGIYFVLLSPIERLFLKQKILSWYKK